MAQVIRLGALVVREGRLLLLRARPDSHWELPGGQLLPEHPDIDEAMDLMLQELGIAAPAVEEDFVETVYLREASGVAIFNLYAPTEWRGEPVATPGVGLGWFALEELDAIAMEEPIRQAVLTALGFRERPDETAAIMEALGGLMTEETGQEGEVAAGSAQDAAPTGPGSRRDAGLDVLRTLRGGDPVPAFDTMRTTQPGLAEDVVDFALGEVWSHPALDRKQRSLMVVSMLSALGRTGPLRSHLNGALNHGVTAEQLVQAMRMVAVYSGFPAAIEAWAVLDSVLTERGIPMPRRPE